MDTGKCKNKRKVGKEKKAGAHFLNSNFYKNCSCNNKSLTINYISSQNRVKC